MCRYPHLLKWKPWVQIPPFSTVLFYWFNLFCAVTPLFLCEILPWLQIPPFTTQIPPFTTHWILNKLNNGGNYHIPPFASTIVSKASIRKRDILHFITNFLVKSMGKRTEKINSNYFKSWLSNNTILMYLRGIFTSSDRLNFKLVFLRMR